MLPEIDEKFAQLKQQYGDDSLSRIEAMMADKPANRQPLQKSAKWIVPGLSEGGWLETKQFPPLQQLVSTLEQNAEQIQSEIQALITTQWEKLGSYDHYLVNNQQWKAWYLFKDGAPTVDQGDVPTVRRILANELKDWLCPLLEMHFSILEPGVEIPPHSDLWNFSINLHLAVDIPENCGIKVANETRQWSQGKCLLFDYSYLHQAWNHSDKNRICLLMDIWHPDLSEAERKALTFFITEIRKYF